MAAPERKRGGSGARPRQHVTTCYSHGFDLPNRDRFAAQSGARCASPRAPAHEISGCQACQTECKNAAGIGPALCAPRATAPDRRRPCRSFGGTRHGSGGASREGMRDRNGRRLTPPSGRRGARPSAGPGRRGSRPRCTPPAYGSRRRGRRARPGSAIPIAPVKLPSEPPPALPCGRSKPSVGRSRARLVERQGPGVRLPDRPRHAALDPEGDAIGALGRAPSIRATPRSRSSCRLAMLSASAVQRVGTQLTHCPPWTTPTVKVQSASVIASIVEIWLRHRADRRAPFSRGVRPRGSACRRARG